LTSPTPSPPCLPLVPGVLVAPRKIAVLHAKALGDFIVTLPALEAIKETYPQAELVLLAKPWVKNFLEARPSPVDRVICVPVLPGVRDDVETKGHPPPAGPDSGSEEIEMFCQSMHAEKFDAIIHMQGDGRSVNPFIKRLGARLTAGMRSHAAERIDRFIPYVHYQNEVLRNLEIAALIGAHTLRLEPRIEVTKTDEREITPLREVVAGRPYIVIHAGADDSRRVWPWSRFAEVAGTLMEAGYQVILTGTPKEEGLVAKIRQASGRSAITSTALGLGALAALLQKSILVISNDTGPLHLARAVGASTVGIFWAPNVLNWGSLNRNRHRLAISWQIECPGCAVKPVSPWPFQPSTAACDHPYSFVESVSTEEVLELASDLLSSTQ
jgi:ADP-heptose:LPS heptosyltransferase